MRQTRQQKTQFFPKLSKHNEICRTHLSKLLEQKLLQGLEPKWLEALVNSSGTVPGAAAHPSLTTS